MPCVLPVLSLKILGVIKHGGGNESHVRSSFLMSAAGIIVSFMLLAAIVIGLKSAGTAVGWGFHFQEPIFIIILVILLNLFAANQWSLFEFRLPYWLGGAIYEKSSKHGDHTPMGNFMTGAFATLMATPCSAPFLGTAVSFALSQGAFQIITTFFMMGVGLASPYLLFAFLPRLVTKLPKPGKWMNKVKHFFGILLIATSVWLIWVLAAQLGVISAIMLTIISIVTIIVLWLGHKRIINKTVFIIAMIIVLILSFQLPMWAAKRTEIFYKNEAIWIKFEQEKIEGLIADGKVVFVDVTADWCLTCKFNKINVMSDDEVLQVLSSDNVVAMKADYTKPSEEITQFLRSYNRYGIPFNIVYGPAKPEGIILSELLTKKAVLDAIKEAGE